VSFTPAIIGIAHPHNVILRSRVFHRATKNLTTAGSFAEFTLSEANVPRMTVSVRHSEEPSFSPGDEESGAISWILRFAPLDLTTENNIKV